MPDDDASRQHRIRTRVDALVKQLHEQAQTDPQKLTAFDFLILLVHVIGTQAARGRPVTLTPAQCSILTDGVVEQLTAWASDLIDVEEASAAADQAAMDRALAAGKPSVLH